MKFEEARKIHETSLSLLEDPGVKIEHEPTAELMIDHGAKTGTKPGVLRLPKELIQECLDSCTSAFPLADRTGNATPLSSTSNPAIWSCPGLNLHSRGKTRPFTSSDMADMARLLDKLEHIQGVFGMAMEDVEPWMRDVAGLAIIAKNTAKHIRAFCFTAAGGEAIKNMKAVIGDYPWFSIGFTAHGPLRWTDLSLSIFQATSGAGIPVTINGEPMAGTSGPVTLAGSVAVGNAEILAGIVAVQLMEPGRPCIYNLGLAHTFDMRTMVAVTGGPENHLFADASAAMGRYYNLPSASWVSTESMIPDSQAAMEKTFGFVSHITSGVSNIWGAGQLESELTISPAQAVIDNEILSYLSRYRRGIEINEDTLAVDLIREVGIAGSYLDRSHTADHYKSELFMPAILNRRKREVWQAAGGKRLDEQAEQTAEELMRSEVDHGMSAEQVTELDRITEEFASSR